MSAVTGDDYRKTAGHPFRGGKIKSLPPGRKNDSIANFVEKVHCPLVKFGTTGWKGEGAATSLLACDPAINRIIWIKERLDNQQYRIALSALGRS